MNKEEIFADEQGDLSKKEGLCYMCGAVYLNWGNNPEPVLSYEKRVCDVCNRKVVIPARLKNE